MKRFALACILLASLSAKAEAAPRRFALLIGQNAGDATDASLRFAETDAQRLSKVLRDMGGFAAEDVLLLSDTNATEVRSALIALNSRIREQPAATTLFVFYSGHSDAEALHLHGTHFSLEELKGLVHGSPAAARVLVIDACRSGAVTRVKGGHAVAPFSIDVDDHLAAEGMAILTSSAAGEDSQESDAIGSSFFTHYLVSGLLGAADHDDDGKVTLDEAFAFASERTRVATSGTITGPQHPTYHFDIGGQGALILTEPSLVRDRFGTLMFPGAGNFVVQKSNADGTVVAEVAAETGGRKLALSTGTYFVTLRARDRLREGKFDVTPGETTTVEMRRMADVAYAQVVRKGGAATAPRLAWSTFATAGGHSQLIGLGGASEATVGGRIDLRPISLELKLAGASTKETFTHRLADASVVEYPSREADISLAALRVYDASRFSVGVGGELGGIILRRHFLATGPLGQKAERSPGYTGFFGGPSTTVEYHAGRNVALRADAGWFLALVPNQTKVYGAAPIEAQGELRITGGIGFYF